MLRRFCWVIVAISACGKVELIPDAALDAGESDAFVCESSKLACGMTCVDPMVDNNHCGSCDPCAAGTACTDGHCVDMVTSCAKIKSVNPAAADGFYTLTNSTTSIYCDMTSGIGYDKLSFDNFNQTPTGYSMVVLADLQTAGNQKAFIALYNRQGGQLPVLDPPMDSVGNCSIKVSTTATMSLALSGAFVEPATVGAAGPTNCTPSYAAGNLAFAISAGPVYAGTSMAADFFTSHPATEIVIGDGNNPAFFWIKVMP